jgi:prefoldin alpha subunit
LASKSEEELRRISVELRFFEQTADALQSRLGMINALATDLAYANTVLEGLDKERENAELLVPIGGSSYIRARLDNPDRIIVGMGAGVSIEKTRQEAKEIIKKRLDDLEKTKMSMQQQFAHVADKINEDRDKLEALVSTIREGKTPKNV